MVKKLLFLTLLSLVCPKATLAYANVTFDSQGTWIINGQREFLYGTHSIPRAENQNALSTETWDRLINYYHINSVLGGSNSKFDELAEKYNVYLIQGSPWIKDLSSFDEPTEKQAIRDQINHPNRIMFYASEENVVGHELVLTGYDYLSNTFPTIPTHINFTHMDTRPPTQPIKDYLTRTKATVISSHVGDAYLATKNMSLLRDELPSLKSVYMLFRMDENPKLEEDIFRAIVAGANGIRFWEPDTQVPHYGGTWGETIATVGSYLAEIKPGLVAPNRTYTPNYMVSKGTDNRYYIIATPSGNALSIPNLPANTQFEHLFYDSGTLTTNNAGTLSLNSTQRIIILRQKSEAIAGGDLNNDGHVNLADFNKLVSGYGTTYNLNHYNRLIANYGK